MSAARFDIFSDAQEMLNALGAGDQSTAVTLMKAVQAECDAGRNPKLERTGFRNVYLSRRFFGSVGYKDFNDKEELVAGFARGRNRKWWFLGAYCKTIDEDGTQLIEMHFAARALLAQSQA